MVKYYVNDNAQPTGEHEVHTENCTHGANLKNRTYLGDFSNCQDAVRKAKNRYSDVDGCAYCAAPCHTK